MDKIILSGMTFYGYHGVFPEENKLGQKFIVDAEVYVSLKEAGRTDDLKHSINYADIYTVVKRIVEEQQYSLIEAIAEQIAQDTLKGWSQIAEVMVRVVKPNPPIAGHYDSVAVEIRRRRDE